MTTVMVSGAVANRPHNGGGAWVRLSWVRGLQRLGLDVVFLEQIEPGACVDEHGAPTAFERSVNRRYFDRVMGQFGLGDCSALICGDETTGLARTELLDRVAGAQLLINISGHLKQPDILGRAGRTAFLDLDPGFTQLWHLEGLQPIAEHDLYFTIAENIGRPGCSLPTAGLTWLTTRQPVVLDDWPARPPALEAPLTTVASWRGPFGPVELNGRSLGAKARQFRRLLSLPERSGLEFELALEIHSGDEADRRALLEHGWRLVDPRQVAGDPDRFRDFLAASAGEFSPAQEIYVETACGWFSDRSVRYLACGRPVVLQDTGFGDNYPVGEGLIAFSDLGQAVAAVRRLAADPAHHAQAARRLAEELFDSDLVLGRFLEQAGVSP